MAESVDLTVQILREIRDAAHETDARLDKLEGTMVERATQRRLLGRELRIFAERDMRFESDIGDLRRG